MRNLKRALSLALAAIMVLGMMVIGAGAASLDDFSDKDEIVNDEAVLVLNTLGVIKGKDNGTYDPKGTVTRGEMAKMICVILNGGKEPNLGETVKNTYTDTASHWAAPYIEYCTTKGIVSGRGDGSFDPNGTVSLAEAAKMLLVALGYNASVQGYVGMDWQIKTDVQANALKLYDGVDAANTNIALTRDNAAQMCYNALDKKMVVYDYVITGTAQNAITTQPQLNDTKKGTLLWEMFGAVKVVGEVTANGFANLSATKVDTDLAPAGTIVGTALDADKTQVVVTNNGDGQAVYSNKAYTFTVESGEEVLGKAVYLYVKPAVNSANSLKATVIGSVVISDDNKIVKDASGDTVKEVADDNNLETDANTQYVYNYAGMGTSDFAAKNGMVGVQKTIVDTDSDNKIDYVLYREMRLGKVTLYSDAKDGQIVVAVDKGNYITKDKDDIAGFDTVAKDDYILTAFFGGKLHVQKAETVTGVINAYKQAEKGVNRNTDFTIDSENYKVSRVLTYKGDIYAAVDTVDKTILSSEATFYMDENGYVVAYGEVDESAYKYAYVWGADAGSTINTDRVKVTLENGTTKTYDLSTNSDIDVIDSGVSTPAASGVKARILETDMVGMVFSYTLTSGGDIKLYLTKGGAITGTTPDFTKGLTTIKVANNGSNSSADAKLMSPAGKTADLSNSYYSNNATTFFYVTLLSDGSVDKVSVYNGRNNAPTVDADRQSGSPTTVLALNNRGDVGAAVFTGVKVSESAGDHMFVYAAKYVSEEYVTVDAFLNGATEPSEDLKAALYLNNEVIHNPDIDKGVYLYKLDSNGSYELTKPTMASQTYYFDGTVTRVNKSNNTFVVNRSDNGGSEEFRLDSKSVTVDYDSNHGDPVAVAGGSVSVGDILQVIVNNADDHTVLMAVIMDRTDATTGNGGSVNITWDGKTQPSDTTRVYPNGTSTTEEAIDNAFKTGDVFIAGNYDLSRNLTIPEGRSLYVTGNLTETAGAPNRVVTNYGSLYVGGSVTLLSNGISLGSKSLAEVAGNLNLAASTTLAGTVKVGGTVNGTGLTLTVTSGAKLYAGKINLTKTAGSILTVFGHAESVNGVIAQTINVYSDETLILGGTLDCDTLNVGSIGVNSTAGKVQAGATTATNVNVVNGSVTTTNLTVATLNVTPTVAGKTTSLTVSGNAAITNPLTINSGASLSVGGKMTTNSGITVDTGKLSVNTLDMKGNTLTIIGSATVEVPTTNNVVVDSKDATGNNINVGTNKNSDLTLAGEIKTSEIYNGEVKIEKKGDAASKLAKDVTLTFNSKVSGLENLTAAEGAKIVFGQDATIASAPANFVDKDGKPVSAKDMAGKTFVFDGTNFVTDGESTPSTPDVKPEDTEIATVKLAGIPADGSVKKGDALATVADGATGSNYTVKSAWTFGGTTVTTATDAGEYTLTVTITANDGYKFTKNTTVDGKASGLTADDKTITVTNKFTVKESGGTTDLDAELLKKLVITDTKGSEAIEVPYYGETAPTREEIETILNTMAPGKFVEVSRDKTKAYLADNTEYTITAVRFYKVDIDDEFAGYVAADGGFESTVLAKGNKYLEDVKSSADVAEVTIAGKVALKSGSVSSDVNLYTAYKVTLADATAKWYKTLPDGTASWETLSNNDYVAMGTPITVTGDADKDGINVQLTVNDAAASEVKKNTGSKIAYDKFTVAESHIKDGVIAIAEVSGYYVKIGSWTSKNVYAFSTNKVTMTEDPGKDTYFGKVFVSSNEMHKAADKKITVARDVSDDGDDVWVVSGLAADAADAKDGVITLIPAAKVKGVASLKGTYGTNGEITFAADDEFYVADGTTLTLTIANASVTAATPVISVKVGTGEIVATKNYVAGTQGSKDATGEHTIDGTEDVFFGIMAAPAT